MCFINKNTEIFSTHDPEELLYSVVDYVESKGYKFKLVDGQFKIKFQILAEEEDPIDVTASVSKVADKKFCLDFVRKNGDSLAFFSHYQEIKDYLGDLIDATN